MDLVQCPICGKDFQVQDIQAHVDNCLSRDVVELPSKAGKATPSPAPRQTAAHTKAGDVLLSDVDRMWAEGKIQDLSSRFCVSYLDAGVALASLCLCNDSTELRSEAVLLIC